MAERLGSSAVFAVGLGLLPAGDELAGRFGLQRNASVEAHLYSEGAPPVSTGFLRLAAAPSLRARIALLGSELAPSPPWMRNTSELARRGRVGLVAAYGCVPSLSACRRRPPGAPCGTRGGGRAGPEAPSAADRRRAGTGGSAVSAICGVIGLDGRPWAEPTSKGCWRVLAPLGRDGGGSWAGRRGAAAWRSRPRSVTARRRTPPTASRPERGRIARARRRPAGRQPRRARVRARRARHPLGTGQRVRPRGVRALGRRLPRPRRTASSRLRSSTVAAAVCCSPATTSVVGPLVIHERAGLLAFASTALALTGFDGVGHALDVAPGHGGARTRLLVGCARSSRAFVGCRRRPRSGSSADGVRRRTWWQPDPARSSTWARPPRTSASCARHSTRRSLRGCAAAGRSARWSAGGSTRPRSPPLRRAARARPVSDVYLGAAARLEPEPSARAGTRTSRRSSASSPSSHPNMVPTFVHIQPGVSPFDLHEPLWELGAVPPRNPCNWLWLHAIGVRRPGTA